LSGGRERERERDRDRGWDGREGERKEKEREREMERKQQLKSITSEIPLADGRRGDGWTFPQRDPTAEPGDSDKGTTKKYNQCIVTPSDSFFSSEKPQRRARRRRWVGFLRRLDSFIRVSVGEDSANYKNKKMYNRFFLFCFTDFFPSDECRSLYVLLLRKPVWAGHLDKRRDPVQREGTE